MCELTGSLHIQLRPHSCSGSAGIYRIHLHYVYNNVQRQLIVQHIRRFICHHQ